ncbi:MAG: hypothetical protein AAEI08_02670 [Gammaproteobacteria bacterium]
MKNIVFIVAVAWLVAPTLEAAPEWAYPKFDPNGPSSGIDVNAPRTVPGSSKTYTQLEIDDDFNPPDWYPGDHPPPPEILLHATDPVRACTACHMASGMGHPQSSPVYGLPVDYFLAQMADFKSGARKDSADWMNIFAQVVSEEDSREAAEYFAALKPVDNWYEVIETDTVPKSFVGDSRLRLRHPDGNIEPLGHRIVEVPQNEEFSISKHPYAGFIAYVPVGSIARGEELVTTGAAGTTVPCNICHGEELRGLANIPRIRGIDPLYAIRQLYDLQTGARVGTFTPLMQATVVNLTEDDMIAIAAYLASLDP